MRDEMQSRDWVENHEAFTTAIADAIDKMRAVFERLRDHYFCAPWDDDCRDVG